MTFDPNKLANKYIRDVKPFQPGKPISEVTRETGISHVIKLASNENPLGPSPKALAAISQALANCHRYPDSNAYDLKQALSAYLNVACEQIILGNGSDEIFVMTTRAFLNEGEEVIFSEYGFAAYPAVTQSGRGIAVTVPTVDFNYDLPGILKAITKRTKLIFIANPENPLGTYCNSEAMQSFLAHVPSRVLVILDQAYCEFIDKPDYPLALDWLAHYPNLIITRTFSKIYGLAGIRVGYGVCHPAVCSYLNRVRLPFHVNALAQVGAIAALEDREHLEKTLKNNQQGKIQLEHGLTQLGLRFIPSVTNFILFDTGGDAKIVFQALLNRGIITRPVPMPGLSRYLRVSIGLPHENQQFLETLAAIFG